MKWMVPLLISKLKHCPPIRIVAIQANPLSDREAVP